MNEQNLALIPYSDIKQMAMAVATSKLFGMQTPEQALTLMLLAQAEGMHPITAARDYDIIQGRPAKKAEAMQRDFLKAGGTIEWHHLSDTAADATFTHPTGGVVRIDWDMKRAIAAELGTKPMWKKYPRQMLRSRVVSEGVRSVFPLATSGLYVPEEIHDFESKERAPLKRTEILVDSAAIADPEPNPEPPKPNGVKIKIGGKAEEKAAPPPPVDVPIHPKSDRATPSEAQMKALWATQGDSMWTTENVKAYIMARWMASSSKDLTRQEVSALIDILKNQTHAEAMSELKAFQE